MDISHLRSASRKYFGSVFINDPPEVVQNGTETALYADDTKLHHTITSTYDCKCLLQSLTNLDSWSMQNSIRFNVSKYKDLAITRKKTPNLL